MKVFCSILLSACMCCLLVGFGYWLAIKDVEQSIKDIEQSTCRLGYQEPYDPNNPLEAIFASSNRSLTILQTERGLLVTGVSFKNLVELVEAEGVIERAD